MAQEVAAGAQEEAKAAKDEARPAVGDAVKKIDEVVEQVDQSEQAQNVKSNILAPIYSLAERFSFPAFHWLAFAVMVTGVVSFALQLVMGKLVVLSRFSLSPTEILSDVLGLAGKSHRFGAHDPGRDGKLQLHLERVFRALGHRGGRDTGIVFYVWGQRQELQAVEGRRRVAASRPAATDERGRS